MDLGSLSAYGRSTTSTAWATNPARRLLWWLVAPYFRGVAIELSAITESKLQEYAARQAAAQESASQDFAARMEAMEASLRSMLSSELGGLRKDTGAIALRLGGLEEEGANAEQARAQLTDWLRKLQEQVQERVAGPVAPQAASPEVLEPKGAAATGTAIRRDERIELENSGLVLLQTAAGTRMLVREQDHIGHIIADGQEWEPHVREAIERAARPDGIAVDAGAYIGVHTLTMARSFSTVHAFEPQRGVYQILCGNLALNGCGNVIAHNTALYDRAGFVRLASQERQETAMPLKDGQPDYPCIANAAALSFDFTADGGDVRAVALDDNELENVRLIKVDTQGADLRVLHGAVDTIRRCRPTVLFEWERDLARQHGATLNAFFDFFSGLNYEVTMIQDTMPGRQADYIAHPR